jgi:hypothetical protein
MFGIWQSVQVTNKENANFGQAGTVQAVNPATPLEVGVKFDSTGILEVVQVADLKAL